jgi:nitroreductase
VGSGREKMSQNIIEKLNWRYATKVFDPAKKVSEKDFDILLETLRLAPSSFGLQSWKFVVVKNPELREKLVAASWKQSQVKDASHLIVLCAPISFDDSNVQAFVDDIVKTRAVTPESVEGYKKVMTDFLKRMNEEQKAQWMKNQIYIALGSLMTVAATMNIDTCPMEGFVPAQYDEILGLTKLGLKSIVVCPVGYRSENDKYATTKKVRFSKSQLVITI